MARHRRPVNVRDDGLPAVLGPLVTVGGLELAVLLDVDSGMVLDAWVCGDGPVASDRATSDAAAWLGRRHAEADDFGRAEGYGRPGDQGEARGTCPVIGTGAMGRVGDGVAACQGPGLAGVTAGGAGTNGDPGPASRRGAGPRRAAAVPGIDPETLGARHADVVRALLGLAGSPPGELSLVVDGRHHLVRCVADPAGGRLALAVVVTGSHRVVRRVRRHLRQLPDAGLTTGPWILSWAAGPALRPPVRPSPVPDTVVAGRLPATADDRGPQAPDGLRRLPAVGNHAVAAGRGDSTAHGAQTPAAARTAPMSGGSAGGLGAMRAIMAVPGGSVGDPSVTEGRTGPASEVRPVLDGDPAPADGRTDPAPGTGGPAVVPDLPRGPAPPSALPPARTAGP